MALILACKDKVSFNLIKTSKSIEFESGDAHLGWTRLVEKYQPSDGQTMIELKEEFTNNKLESEEDDPDEWVTELENIQSRPGDFNYAITDQDVCLHILMNLPSEYENTVEMLMDSVQEGTLAVNKIRGKLRAKFKRLNKVFLKQKQV